jgi:hypothetical protein
MARSNTLPVDPPQRNTSTLQAQRPKRSTTAGTQLPPQTHKNRASKILHPHSPFHHRDSSDVSTASKSSARPGAPQRMNSVQTRYMTMLLNLDTIPRLHNILASFFCWILLAGFVIFPATFTSIGALTESELDPLAGDPQATEFIDHVKNISLLYIAGFCSGIGAGGMIWLWWRWRANFVWLLNRIFLPGCLNSLAGLISTLINVYTQHTGVWSVTAWVTLGVTGGSTAICGLLFLIYNFVVLSRVKSKHRMEMGREADDDHEGEGLVEKLERKAKEPALEPGSVV